MSDRISNAAKTRHKNYQARNQRLVKRFNFLYNVERKRIDDVYTQLYDEFSLSQGRIDLILRITILPKDEPVQSQKPTQNF